MELDGVELILLAEDRLKWLAMACAVIKLPAP
jgi:hypothetical protein